MQGREFRYFVKFEKIYRIKKYNFSINPSGLEFIWFMFRSQQRRARNLNEKMRVARFSGPISFVVVASPLATTDRNNLSLWDPLLATKYVRHPLPSWPPIHSTGRMGWMAHRKWKDTKQLPGTAGPGNMLGFCLISFHFLLAIHPIRPVLLKLQKQEKSTEWMEWMSHRKRRETKQQLSMLPGPAVPVCCLVSFLCLCYIDSIHSVTL